MNSPLTSILKSSSVNLPGKKLLSHQLQVRFETPAAIDVVGILKDYIEGRNEDRYTQLLGLRNDPNVNDLFLLMILQQVNKSICVLVPKVEHFVDALLNVSWTNRPKHIVEEYQSFVQTLASAHSYYCKTVIRTLVGKFTLGSGAENGVQYAHETLYSILQLIPLSRSLMLDSLNDCFPYIGSEGSMQVNYVKNLLRFSEYCESSRSYILNVIIGRLVKLDSRVSREDLLKLQAMSLKEAEETAPVSVQVSHTLDMLMIEMFDYCQQMAKLPWEEYRVFYKEMYSSFESLILPAMGIDHTHFLIFAVCSTKPVLYEAFIERLWNVFQTPSSPLNIRKAAADYLASFLGKANFIPVKIVTFCLERVCQWIHAYLDRQKNGEGAAVFKIRAHLAFYAACHIPFYVIAARHNDLIGNKKLLTSLQSLDLTRIVTSNLNPLRYCHPTAVRQFAESASHLQIAYCHTIIVRNQRHCLSEANSENHVMDTVYPFEKYLLPNSNKYVSTLIIDTPIGREDSLYDSDQVMEELLSESPRVGGYMHHFLA